MANKVEITRKVRKTTGLSYRDAAEAVDSFVEFLADAIASGERVEIRGVGTFYIAAAAERKTPLNGAAVIPAHKRVVFRPCEKLRRAVWGLVEK